MKTRRMISMMLAAILCIGLIAALGGPVACADNDPSKAADSSYRYTITLVDEKGEPVNGCMINICSGSACNPQQLKNTNVFAFNGINDEPYAYVVHVLKVPDGYTVNKTQEYVLKEAGDSLTIVIAHA